MELGCMLKAPVPSGMRAYEVPLDVKDVYEYESTSCADADVGFAVASNRRIVSGVVVFKNKLPRAIRQA